MRRLASQAAIRRVLLFPGQGSQKIGMGFDLTRDFPYTRETFQEADEALSFPLSRMMFSGDQVQLNRTEYAQPAILSHSLAIFRVICRETGLSIQQLCTHVMGHSLGEYSSLCAASALSLTDAVRLVRQRGIFMQLNIQEPTTMAALTPLNAEVAERLCQQAQQMAAGVCSVASINSASQVVLSGHERTVNAAIRLGQELKHDRVRRATVLAVSSPFHCSLMDEAAQATRRCLEHVALRDPLVPLITNLEASELSSAAQIKQALVQVMTRTVRWAQAVELCAAKGTSQYVECGSGVLSALMARSSATNFPLQDSPSLQAFLKSQFG